MPTINPRKPRKLSNKQTSQHLLPFSLQNPQNTPPTAESHENAFHIFGIKRKSLFWWQSKVGAREAFWIIIFVSAKTFHSPWADSGSEKCQRKAMRNAWVKNGWLIMARAAKNNESKNNAIINVKFLFFYSKREIFSHLLKINVRASSSSQQTLSSGPLIRDFLSFLSVLKQLQRQNVRCDDRYIDGFDDKWFLLFNFFFFFDNQGSSCREFYTTAWRHAAPYNPASAVTTQMRSMT